ncbi:MAG: SAM-dependent methyltransferase [Acidimicrobiia bacterium]|nr:SAM-dependent methyltransferase [Acidimicrobiia bacterium]
MADARELRDRLLRRIDATGPLTLEEYLDTALYDPELGFYACGGAAGRRGDFLTAPEVGPLFGAVIADALDTWWTQLGEPEPFEVVEAGAGRGALARGVLDARPRCATALRYVLVERSAVLRARQAELLDLTDDDGPGVAVRDDLPPALPTGVVLANELLDNLPWRLLELVDGRWWEVRVGARTEGLVEQAVPADPEHVELVHRLVPDPPPGARVPLQLRARAWVDRVRGLLGRGRVVVFDYMSTTPELASRPVNEWLRTYRGHDRGVAPLREPGTQDITCEVAVDQLHAPDLDRSQADFLDAHGIRRLAEEGRRIWEARAHIGDLEAIRARSRVAESRALTDPSGMGAFRVLEWIHDR